jgi:hypothetical protein
LASGVMTIVSRARLFAIHSAAQLRSAPLYEKVFANALTTAYGAPSSLTARAQICVGSRTPL